MKGENETKTAAPRLHKHLAELGLGSRREIERWILTGRVAIDGRPARLGERVPAHGTITLDGRPILAHAARRPRVLLYHKPVGELCARSDPLGRRLVFDALPRLREGRWISVGRLDYASEGLLLFTTNGEWAQALMHPRHGVARRYAVRIRDPLGVADERRLQEGVCLEDGPAVCEELRPLGGSGRNRWYEVVVREGRHRLVRRLFEAVGHPVSRLIRTAYGPFVLPPDLRRGRSHELDDEEVRRFAVWIQELTSDEQAVQGIGDAPPQ